ncbi:maleylpyruvate isomerase family mycothiol-dependent enzyme [Actinomadura sp. 21ATH]|uniref:maleylpyruvate isomerase family mycothiol-dependent enzyme n=1 Tax=Actinomadura sp. 21ATH TaxID=1735444 RepID=UPI0035BF36BE
MNPEPWSHSRHGDAAETEIAAYATLLDGADLAAPVPTCPGWTVGELTVHLGGTHRWAEATVRLRVPERRSRRALGVTDPAAPEETPAWYREGGALLMRTLRATGGDVPVWGWGPDHHARFWSRRMLHETAVHRCDLEIALGRRPEVDRAVAVDGIDELLENLPSAAAFSPNVANLRGDGAELGFETADAGTRWTLRLLPDGFEWARADGGAGRPGASVRGSASDVYLFLWGRLKPGDPALEFSGDGELLRRWTENSAVG